MTDFDELVGGDDLSPEEAARLHRVHELLIEAGPPPDLPPALEHPSEPAQSEIVQFPLLPRRRVAIAAIAAALLVLVGFGGGYLLGHSKARSARFAAQRVVIMHGPGADGVLRLGARDAAGNWPMEVEVSGLPSQPGANDSYAVWLTRRGKPVEPCGWFRVHGRRTTVRFTVPYPVQYGDGWVVTAQPAAENGIGKVVLSS